MEPKKLRKSRCNKKIAGVCGGVAEYFNVDATLVRLIWIGAVFTAFGIPLYVAGMILMPD